MTSYKESTTTFIHRKKAQSINMNIYGTRLYEALTHNDWDQTTDNAHNDTKEGGYFFYN